LLLYCLGPPIGFIASKTKMFLAFQSFNFEHTWWLFHKYAVSTKSDIYVFIDNDNNKVNSQQIQFTYI
jgi:hypothetical protein